MRILYPYSNAGIYAMKYAPHRASVDYLSVICTR